MLYRIVGSFVVIVTLFLVYTFTDAGKGPTPPPVLEESAPSDNSFKGLKIN